MRILTAVLLVLVPTTVALAAPGIELRAVSETAGPGTVQMSLKSSGKLYFVGEPKQVITGAEIVAAVAAMGPSGPVVNVSFSRAGGQKVNAITTQLLGRQLAVIVGQDLVFVATIQEPISDQMSLSGMKSLQDAKMLAAEIQQLRKDADAAKTTVYVKTTTSSPRPDKGSVTFVVRQRLSRGQAAPDVARHLALYLQVHGYRTTTPAQAVGGDRDKQLVFDIVLRDTQEERMNIEVTVFKVLNPPGISLQWNGTFEMDTGLFRSSTDHVLEEIVKHYDSPDVTDQERW